MFYSYNAEIERTTIFSLFIKKIIEGNDSYIDEVNSVIFNVKEYISGEKDIYSIDRSYFSIIMFLVENNPDFFKNLDIKKIKVSDYRKIDAFLEAKSKLLLA